MSDLPTLRESSAVMAAALRYHQVLHQYSDDDTETLMASELPDLLDQMAESVRKLQGVMTPRTDRAADRTEGRSESAASPPAERT